MRERIHKSNTADDSKGEVVGEVGVEVLVATGDENLVWVEAMEFIEIAGYTQEYFEFGPPARYILSCAVI